MQSLRLLERRSGHPRAELRFPEEDGARTAPWTFAFASGPQEYAIEHTRIEPFADQNQDRQPLLTAREASGGDPLRDASRTGVLRTSGFPLDPSLRVSGAGLTARVNALIESVRGAAQPLFQRSLAACASESHPRYFQASVEVRPPGFPYPVTLCCSVRTAAPGKKRGQLLCVRVAPGDDELEASPG